jgi:hypothetical protein
MSIEGEAKSLLNNEAFLAALEYCRGAAIQGAMTCDAKDDHGRRVYLDAAKTVDRVKAFLAAQLASKGTPVEISDYFTKPNQAIWERLRGYMGDKVA